MFVTFVSFEPESLCNEGLRWHVRLGVVTTVPRVDFYIV